MTIITVTKQHPTYTEVKYLKLLMNWKWWNGTTYFNLRVVTQYILNN
jgi:hypothetical protein